MKKLRSICGKVLLVCMALLLLTGCRANEETQVERFVLTAENSVEITLVNASGYPAEEFRVWCSGRQGGFDPLYDLDRNLEPDEIITLRIPKDDDNIYSFNAWADEEEAGSLICLARGSDEYIPEGGIIVLVPGDYYNDLQIIFEAGTDVETAKETALSQYQAAYDAEQEAAEEEETQEETLEETQEETTDPRQKKIDEAVKLLGYDSLADMRTKENPDIIFRDFDDEWEMQENDAYYQLYGYWYPNGDRNSLTYLAITDGEFMWYQFDPEQGDVQMGKLRLAAASGGRNLCTFTLGDGNKFTVERTSVFQDMSQGTLTFEDCTKEYSDNVEYYYSKY